MLIGTDILFIPRIKKMENNEAFLKKIYTSKEREIANTFKEPTNFYATRFAAKEAIIKATNGKFDFNEIEILKDEDGKPLPHIINHQEITINLSLSFDNDYATAFCIIKK